MKISVLMLSYNRPDYLRIAIDSVINQTHNDWELVIVDDSDDPKIFDMFDLSDDRIIIHRLEHRRQIAIKRDVALHAASGIMSTPLDDDDVATPNRLADISAAYEKKPDDFLYGMVKYIKLQSNTTWKQIKPGYAKMTFDSQLTSARETIKINGGAVAFNTQLAIDVGGYCDRIGTIDNKKSMCGEDWSIYRRILQKANGHRQVPTVWSTIRRHDTNISRF